MSNKMSIETSNLINNNICDVNNIICLLCGGGEVKLYNNNGNNDNPNNNGDNDNGVPGVDEINTTNDDDMEITSKLRYEEWEIDVCKSDGKS